MKQFFAIFLLSIFSFSLFAQKKVLPVAQIGDNITAQGFYYMLPLTAFICEVAVIKNTDMKGYYADYANNLLNLNNIIDQDKISYQIKEVSITPFTTADTNHCYWVEYSSAQIKRGLPDKIGVSKTAIETPQNSSYGDSIIQIPEFYRTYADLAYIEKDASFVETKIINGVVTQVPVNKTRKVSKTTAQQAQEVADLIASIRQARYDLLVGVQEVAYSKEAIQYMIEQLNQNERNYLGLFTGFSVQEEIKYVFIIIPEDEKTIPVFSFSTENGVNKVNDTQKNNNYYLNIVPEIFHNQWEKAERSKQTHPKFEANTGYRIRRATPATIILSCGEQNKHFFGRYLLYQLGKIEVLPLGRDSFDIINEVIIY
jgi:hypothetical protein